MKSSDQVGITFVNAVVGRGVLNGVVNIQLGGLLFDSGADGKISNDLATVCRLRMDAKCAEDLRDHLNAVLTLIDEAKAKAGVSIATNGVDHSADGKPN
jgi:hypothetical protein